MKRHPRRSDQEWLNIIHECRTSGLPDKTWCEENGIQPSNFYYHIRRLRAMACEITERENAALSSQVQEVVPVSFSKNASYDTTLQTSSSFQECTMDEVITIQMNGIRLGITNMAAKDTIINTLSALQTLC